MSSYTIHQELPYNFIVLDKKTNTIMNVPYLTQYELSQYWIQNMPSYKKNNNFNHFHIILAYLPENLWHKLYNNNKTIIHGTTKYTIIETNQDKIIIELFEEIHKICPKANIIKNIIEQLDDSLYSSWLVIRAKTFI